MLNTIKKTKSIIIIFILTLCYISCQKNKSVKTHIYKNGLKVHESQGTFYSTKYGGLNYYISNEKERNTFFNIQNIDSINFVINDIKYNSEPLIMRAFSRERNDSDFSFSIDKNEHKIIIDTINNMNTISIFSEKTDIERLKKDGKIDFIFVDINLKKR